MYSTSLVRRKDDSRTSSFTLCEDPSLQQIAISPVNVDRDLHSLASAMPDDGTRRSHHTTYIPPKHTCRAQRPKKPALSIEQIKSICGEEVVDAILAKYNNSMVF